MGWGDDIMVTGQARAMQQNDPRRVQVLYEQPRWPEAYAHNTRLARYDEQGDFQILRPRQMGLRPYMVGKSPDRWTWRAYQPLRGEIWLTDAERAFGDRYAGRIIVEPHIKPGASPNKHWGWVRWNKLAWLLQQRGVQVAQMGRAGTPVLEGVDFIETANLRQAAAVLSRARAAVLPEGGLHHTAAVFEVPTVVIYGGFISPEVTGYEGQRAFFVKTDEYPLGCGWRRPCEHCMKAMGLITPEAVSDALIVLLRPTQQPSAVAA